MNRLLFVFLALALACESGTVKNDLPPDQLSIKQRLERIRETYRPAECFSAAFGVESKQAGQSAQSADGSLRVDNLNKRVRLYFVEPIFGITLSHVTIRDGFVYVGSPRDATVQIPLDRFVLSGLGNNTIRLPFRLFQDLMYGRIPEEVFSTQARYTAKENRLLVNYEDAISRIAYEFEGDRLRLVNYYHKSDRANARADLTGAFRNTPFPQTVELAGWIDGPPEKMTARFSTVDMNAVCKDAQFPINQ
ncbi:MAG: hypothetical protein K8S54_16345 [Spirochaetia bacterium]|nr:hypothetical protein [Spirochaetia bacterium]